LLAAISSDRFFRPATLVDTRCILPLLSREWALHPGAAGDAILQDTRNHLTAFNCPPPFQLRIQFLIRLPDPSPRSRFFPPPFSTHTMFSSQEILFLAPSCSKHHLPNFPARKPRHGGIFLAAPFDPSKKYCRQCSAHLENALL